jgi:hypothetical protein
MLLPEETNLPGPDASEDFPLWAAFASPAAFAAATAEEECF